MASRGGARATSDGRLPDVFGVVGGIADVSRASDARLFLALATPSARTLPQGVVRVDESLAPLARFAAESRDFLLGAPQPDGEGEWVLRPFLDYRAGLYELVVAAPADIDRPADEPLPDELFEMIKVDPQPTPTTPTAATTTANAPRIALVPSTPTTGPSSATTKELQDLKAP